MKRVRCGAALALALVSCARPERAAPEDAARTGDLGARRDGAEIVRLACRACHGEDLLAQQRLPRERWAATIKKMVGWGAALDPGDGDVLAAYLAERYGPDAGAYRPALVSAEHAAAALAPLPDGPWAGGDAARGGALFAARCVSCHGADARGLPALGVALSARPILYRAAELAATVRAGRGRMPAQAVSDGELGDLLAHLRSVASVGRAEGP